MAAKVNDGTITSSPGPIPAASRPKMQPGCTGVDGNRGASVDKYVAELLLELRYFRPLGELTAQKHLVDSMSFLIADDGARKQG